MTFAADLARFVQKASGNSDKVVRTVTMEVANSVIEMSPVDTGRFRANWQHGSNAVNLTTTDDYDPDGSVTSARIAGSVSNVKAGGVEFITNNLPYAQRLEYGYSQQAPQGMVRVTVARFRELLARAARGIR